MSGPAVWVDDHAIRALPGIDRQLASAGAWVMRTFARCPNPAVVAHFQAETKAAVVSGSQTRDLLARIELATTTLRVPVVGVLPRGGGPWPSVRMPGLVDVLPADTADAARRILLMARVPIVSGAGRAREPPPSPALDEGPSPEGVIAIASSTGGAWVLAELLLALDRARSGPVLIAQHLEGEFVPFFAQWLESTSRWPVRMVDAPTPLTAGTLHLAVGGRDLCVALADQRVLAERPNSHFTPSANRLFRSLAYAFGSRATGVVLSGMGADGADGLAEILARGGRAYCQLPASAVIPSMPEHAVARGASGIPPALLAAALCPAPG